MRTSTLAMVVALGSVIAPPVLAQQQTVPNPQMQEEADKGAKTRQSGESGYVGEQEKSGASAHAPGRPRRQPGDDGLDQWNEQHFAVWNGREISLSMNWKSGYRSRHAKRDLEDLAIGLIGSA